MLEAFSKAGAVFNEKRTERYLLWRTWELTHHPPRTIGFILLNPSIADDKRLDPTLTRCLGFSKRWKFGRMIVGNLYSTVSTDPARVDFERHESTNFDYLRMIHSLSERVVIGWGTRANNAIAHSFFSMVSDSDKLYCLGINLDKSPKHPLYLKRSNRLQRYRLRWRI